MTCKNCEVAGHLEEEARMKWYGEDEASRIRALALAWHDECKGCDCKVEPRERGLLHQVQALCRHLFRLHVQEMH